MLCEQPFRSDVRVVGPLIAWFRSTWNSVSTRWYVLPLVQQQNEFNALVVSHLQEMNERMTEMSERMTDLDRDQTALTRNVAELTFHVIRLGRAVEALQVGLQDPGAELGKE